MNRRKFLTMLGLTPVALVAAEHLPVPAAPAPEPGLEEARKAAAMNLIVNGKIDPGMVQRAELQARRMRQVIGCEDYPRVKAMVYWNSPPSVESLKRGRGRAA